MENRGTKAFRHWMKRLSLTRKKASDALGIHMNTVGGYNTGRRGNGEPVEVPKMVLLACAAVENDILPIKPERGED